MSLFLSLFTIASGQSREKVTFQTLGLDMELLSYGGSMGGFYGFHFSEAFSLDVEMDWSIIESNDSFSYYNYYNQPVVVNNRNLSFVKLMPGFTWFPFLKSMHPSMQAGVFASAGPIWSLNTADDEPFLDRWKKVETHLTPMIRAGVNMRIMSGQGTSYNFRLGYDYASFDEVIDSRQTYKGIFFQAGMEFLHR
ncbi:MAG: hypothetical protein HQ508_07430 [Candidatus Marinimicrobia bacterium]|nr:hypothetical protein [Candidatus Neomarinimicrobiota bacterium]